MRSPAAGRSWRTPRHQMGGRHRHQHRHQPLQQPQSSDRHHQSARPRGRQPIHAEERPGPGGVPGNSCRPYRFARPLASIRNVHRHSHAAGGRLSPQKGPDLLMRAAARAAFLSVLLTAAAIPAAEPQPCVQAVEFPYFLYPQQLWERELVWLKNIGIHTVEFPVPLQWHQLDNGQYDFSGRTSPRRDLVGSIRLLRKLGMEAWIAQPSNVPELRALLETQAASHGGPLISRPASVATVSALEPDALARSRDALAAGRAAVLWTNVEDQLYPAGWQPAPAAPLVHGVIGLSGDEHPGALALRREAALARNWG